jgi:type II secretory pathway component PulF
MKQCFLWEAMTLQGNREFGLIQERSRKAAVMQLLSAGYHRPTLEALALADTRRRLSISDLLYLIDALASALESGISMRDTLELLSHDRKHKIVQFVFLSLRDQLHQGRSLETAFRALAELFPPFFIAMIGLGEKSGDIRQGLRALRSYYQNLLQRQRELNRLLRYPKIVLGITGLLSLGIVVFIIPLFQNIYQLFEDDLPWLTSVMVALSALIRQHGLILIVVFCLMMLWRRLPGLNRFHPWHLMVSRFGKMFRAQSDRFLFSHSMQILLENGLSIKQAVEQATACLSTDHQPHGHRLAEALKAGQPFSVAFRADPWFPDIFNHIIAATERTGALQFGFSQIYQNLCRRREAQFERWSNLIEPLLMVVLGAVVLLLLLSIYLPVFELGNRLG